MDRELSLLAFNERVLAQCEAAQTPLLERVRYLAIVSANLDEFFEVRVAELKAQLRGMPSGKRPGETSADSLRQSIERIAQNAHALVEKQYRVLNAQIVPALKRAGLGLLGRDDLTPPQKRALFAIFRDSVQPTLQPVRLNSSCRFPAITSRGLYYIVELSSRRKDRQPVIAVLKVPRALHRLWQIDGINDKERGSSNVHRAFVTLCTLIELGLPILFRGRSVLSFSEFRVTRDSAFRLNEQDGSDFREAVSDGLRRRSNGRAVRLEINAECRMSRSEFLRRQFKLDLQDVYRVDGMISLTQLLPLVELGHNPALRFPVFTPGCTADFLSTDVVFEQLKRADTLLHHPYQSFEPVVQFLRAAVADPNVLAIKQTIYRIGARSPLMELLLEAVRRGKHVTVIVELTARFDEATNINWANKFERAGAQVVYGRIGLKTHAKMALVLRREGDTVCAYAHVGTGNYNPATARSYTDFGILTANPEIGRDVGAIFDYLANPSLSRSPPKLKRLWLAPHTFKRELIAHIRSEARDATLGKPARIIAKINSLTDETVIDELIRAAQSGVNIDLIVRGACCLVPPSSGAVRIHVRSIVGRFLEHSRIYYFENEGSPQVYLSSADCMARNLDRRVEVAIPILDTNLRVRVVNEGLLEALRDNSDAWTLLPNGSYERVQRTVKSGPVSVQQTLVNKWQ